MIAHKKHHDLSAGPILLAIGAVFCFTALDGIAKELGSASSDFGCRINPLSRRSFMVGCGLCNLPAAAA